MKRLSLIIAVILGIILSAIFVCCFAWIFWLLGADDIFNKWNSFMNSLVFNK